MALPKKVIKARFKLIFIMFGLMAVTFAAGALFVSPLVGLGLMVLVELGFFVVFFSRIQHVGWDKLKADLRAKLSLPGTLPVSLVCYVTRTPRIWNLTLPFEAALLVESEAGFAVLGENTRVLIPIGKILSARTRRIVMNPPRTSLQLDLPEGPRYLSFLDEKTFRANKALAVACAERVRARLSASAPAPRA